MIFARGFGKSDRSTRDGRWIAVLLWLSLFILPARAGSLPDRLVLLLDGISHRDMQALQEGVVYQDKRGRRQRRQAFHRGYFPVSRLVSTFPSVSDPAWTEILGGAPLPGYQRTYFDATKGSQVFVNGVTSSMEYERQMTWQMEHGFGRVMSYVSPLRAFEYEVNAMAEHFLKTQADGGNYYALIHSTDSAQHLSGDVFEMLCTIDAKLEALRAACRAREGRDLEILLLSDHGNNHAGRGKRVAVRSFLTRAGYRIAKSLQRPKDVVLPTAGIESWIEIHNAPGETERLLQLLSRLEGADILTGRVADDTNRFIVMNSKGERAIIESAPDQSAFRYAIEHGDPLGYQPVMESLAGKRELGADGFASAEAWLAATLTHRYPVALERIVRGHTRVTLNPATILVSLQNDYIHCGWWIKRGEVLVESGGTHGGLDDLNSNGILLSNFAPTRDTTTSRVAAQVGGFTGLRNHAAEQSVAEWIVGARSSRGLLAQASPGERFPTVPVPNPMLRVRNAAFQQLKAETPLLVTIERARRFRPAKIRRGDGQPAPLGRHLTFDRPIFVSTGALPERIYALPAGMSLAPETHYQISGRIRAAAKTLWLFQFTFRTDDHGRPLCN